MKEIELGPPNDLSRRLWSGVRRPQDWVLVGGLMAQLHAVELGGEGIWVTQDVDVLGQARPRGTLDAIGAALQPEGFVPRRA